MLYIVDKKVIRHIVEHDGRLLEIPVRAEFEYGCEKGEMVDGSLKISTLYNQKSVARLFPRLNLDELDDAIDKTVRKEILEHIAFAIHRLKGD